MCGCVSSLSLSPRSVLPAEESPLLERGLSGTRVRDGASRSGYKFRICSRGMSVLESESLESAVHMINTDSPSFLSSIRYLIPIPRARARATRELEARVIFPRPSKIPSRARMRRGCAARSATLGRISGTDSKGEDPRSICSLDLQTLGNVRITRTRWENAIRREQLSLSRTLSARISSSRLL